MEIKKSIAFRAPVRMMSGSVDVTGVLYSGVTVYIQKQAGSSALKTVTNSDWFQIDATNMPGLYDLLLSAGDVDTTGYLKYRVAHTASQPYVGLLEIVDNIESDTYATSLLAKSSADTAATNANNAATQAGFANTAATNAYNGTTTINNKLGTPFSGTVSADLSATYHAVLNVSGGGGGPVTASVDLTPVLDVLGTPFTTISKDIYEVAKLARGTAELVNRKK